jgi:GH24 family phage-related lysozyme (muramidase)
MTKEGFIKALIDHEGSVSHMYLCTSGKVTIGIGLMLEDVDEAKKLEFIRKSDGKDATKPEIEEEYKKIKGLEKGQGMSFYNDRTNLLGKKESLDREFERRLKLAENDARKFFPGFDKLPQNAQFVLIDLAFNIGGTKFVKSKWPCLYKALEERNWRRAAKETKGIYQKQKKTRKTRETLM